ncbi:IS3 family transposase, partial [Alteribacillus sp. JSM 102045]|uniref:IS3 family transposase n=1 Tax=Alteribacillus sp. JSM 102045 TaxID=1562101 RepID=UPI0035BEB6D5
MPRSTYYYQTSYRVEHKKVSEGRPIPGYSFTNGGKKVSDEQIKEWLLEEIEGEAFAYGYRKLTVILRRRYGLAINKKKVYRLCKELGILRPQRQPRPVTKRKRAKNRTITDSNQLWETDLKYGFIHGEDRFFFVLSYIDVYDRTIIDYHIGLSCTAADASRTLQQAMMKRQVFDTDGLVIRSDNGPQYKSLTFAHHCDTFGVEHEQIPPKSPNSNAHIEAFHRLLEDDCFQRFEFKTYEEAYREVTSYIAFYNERRLHGSILDLS